MRRALVTPERLLSLIVVLLLLMSFLPVRAAGAVGQRAQWVLNFVLVPLQQPLKAVSETVRPAEWGRPDLGDAEQLEQQYAALLVRNRELADELERTQRQLERLTQMSQRPQLAGRAFVDAAVARYSGEPTNPRLTIDRGRSQGIEPGQVVVWDLSLIGLVDAASPRTAEVKLITAPDTRLNVLISSPEADAQRQLREQIQLAADRRSFYVDVDINQPVEVGDLVHLSDEFGIWPREANGLFVGQVADITDQTENMLLLKRVVIKPMVDLARLRQVTVVKPVE